MKELTFDLENKIRFANLVTAEEDETMQITLKAPTFEDRKQYARIHSHASSAMLVASTKVDQSAKATKRGRKADEEMDGAAALGLLSACSKDFDEVLDDFTELALRVGRINEDTPLKIEHIERTGIDELMRMLGEYVAFFVMPSLLSMGRKSGSAR